MQVWIDGTVVPYFKCHQRRLKLPDEQVCIVQLNILPVHITTVSPVVLSVVHPVTETLSKLLESDSKGRRGGERHGDPAGVPGKNGRAEEDARGVPETNATGDEDAKPIGHEARTGEADADATRKGCVEPTEANGRAIRSARSGEDRTPTELGRGSGKGDVREDGVPRGSTGSTE
jgi:hypothetical protein